MTEIITGRDAEIILDEMRNGTPNTEKRIETIRRVDEIFRRQKEMRQQCRFNDTEKSKKL